MGQGLEVLEGNSLKRGLIVEALGHFIAKKKGVEFRLIWAEFVDYLRSHWLCNYPLLKLTLVMIQHVRAHNADHLAPRNQYTQIEVPSDLEVIEVEQDPCTAS
jgi:hypothetical protein